MHSSELFEKVSRQVITAMETSGVDWCKSWAPIGGRGPFSIDSGNSYTGFNTLILGLSRMSQGWSSNEFGTFKSWRRKGYSVAKGQKGTHITYYASGKKTIENDNGQEETKAWRTLKLYTVFNAEQILDYTPADIEDVPEFTANPNTAMDTLAADVGVDVRNVDLAQAFYAPDPDYVNMPRIEQFDSAEAYACTLGHEITHWTKHKSRLDRKEGRAVEELVAEMGSAMLAASLGISPTPREDHATYLNSWIKELKDKPSSIQKASAKAQAATSYLLNAQSQKVGLAA
jgi:antirestriction protein ArdC